MLIRELSMQIVEDGSIGVYDFYLWLVSIIFEDNAS
jgi:hypothetical protein